MTDVQTTGIEFEWMQWLESKEDPRPALKAFSRQYHFFSLSQVIAFSGLFRIVSATDRQSLALLAGVLFEELGCNDPAHVHSILFERFAISCGVAAAELPISLAEVAPGVRWYVCELQSAFGGHSLPRALATYQFLESSAVETYGPLLEVLRRLGFAEHSLEFFALHAQVEVEHAKAATDMVERAKMSESDQTSFDDQKKLLTNAWSAFWRDLWAACRATYE